MGSLTRLERNDRKGNEPESMTVERRKNILIITDNFAMMAGSERNITQVMTGIDRDKFQIFVASFLTGKLADEMREQGFSVFPLHPRGLHTMEGLKNLAFLRRMIVNNKISLLVTYHENSDVYGLVMSRICNIPIISNRRDMGYKTKFRHKLLYRSSGRFYDAVITVCDAIKAEVVKRRWFPADKISSIYNGVDLSKFGITRDNGCLKREVGIDPMGPVVGFIGNIRRIKGIEYFIEAASIVLQRNSNVEFLIIGEDFKRIGYARSDLELLGKKLNASNKIHFIGKRNDVVELISIFDVGVVPSLSEGFSNVILEYMASSKPVVATNVGGNPEAVIHGETGFLVPPRDSVALAEAISSMLENSEMRQRFGVAGRRRAENQFSMKGMLRSYEEVFDRTLRLKRNREPIKIIEN